MVNTIRQANLELLSDTNQLLKGRAYTRYMRKTHISKRMQKDLSCHMGRWYKFNGQYSKGKIHCSCPMCSTKTRKNGYKISDKRKLISMVVE